MNRRILALFSCITGTLVLAPAVSARDALIDLDNAKTGGFGGPVFKASEIKGDSTIEIGAIGGATFTTGLHSVTIGGGGFSLVNELEWNETDKLEMGYGGFIFGYTYNPESVIHVDTQILMGAGGVNVLDENSRSADSGTFLITELSSQVEVNITEFFEFGIGASYRFTTDPSLANLDENDLSNPGIFVSFQFGYL